MNSKRLTYLLFPIVALIWGYAIYKYVFAEYEGDGQPNVPTISRMDSLPQLPTQPDSFSLIRGYRDPFLGTIAAPRKIEITEPTQPMQPATATVNQPKAEVAVEPPKVVWAEYHYNGMIQHSGTSDQAGILRIGTKSYFVNVGSVAQGAIVLALTGDSIRLRVAGESKTIGRR